MTQTSSELPEIPDKRYFTIGEVSELCLVKPHVLRYWEQEFPQLRPVKRRGNRRYYMQQDIRVVRDIRELLYHQGFTISGARAQMKEKGKAMSVVPPGSASDSLAKIRAELESILESMD